MTIIMGSKGGDPENKKRGIRNIKEAEDFDPIRKKYTKR